MMPVELYTIGALGALITGLWIWVIVDLKRGL